jgi:predicted transcriptional regulator of viral defense system
MNSRGKKLGPLETQLFTLTQLRGLEQVRTGDLVAPLGITPKQERELLSRMARAGIIVRLKRGVYLLPQKLPPGGKWTPSEYILIARFMEEIKAKYQLTGLAAFNFYGLNQQVPNEISVYNDKVSGKRKLGPLTLNLIRVSKRRLGGTRTLSVPGGSQVKVGTLERILVDAIYDWSRFGTLPECYEWVLTLAKNKRIKIPVLADTAIKFGNTGLLRRLGYLLEKNGAPRAVLKEIERKIPKSSGLIPFIPTKKARGTIDRRWGIVFNG